jgi:hypothetical protein
MILALLGYSGMKIQNGVVEKVKITSLQSSFQVHNEFLLAGDEEGNMYRFEWKTGQLQKTLKLHAGRISGFIVRNNRSIYSISDDAHLRKIDLEVTIQ